MPRPKTRRQASSINEFPSGPTEIVAGKIWPLHSAARLLEIAINIRASPRFSQRSRATVFTKNLRGKSFADFAPESSMMPAAKPMVGRSNGGRARRQRDETGSVSVGPPFFVPIRLIRVIVSSSEKVALVSASRSSM